MLLMGLRRHARAATNHGRRLLCFGDNLGVCLAFERSRASDRALQALAARAAAYRLGCEIRWSIRHLPGSRNVADWTSRAADRGELKAGQFRSRTSPSLRPPVRLAPAPLPGLGPPAPSLDRSSLSSTKAKSGGGIFSLCQEAGADGTPSARALKMPRRERTTAPPSPPRASGAAPSEVSSACVRRVGGVGQGLCHVRFFLELYAGCGRLSAAMHGAKISVAPPF